MPPASEGLRHDHHGLAKVQVGSAFNGKTLTLEQAGSRWFAVGYPISAFAVVPAIASPVSLALAVWSLVILFAFATSATRQGPHDRLARSAVVRRVGERTPTALIGCVVLLFLAIPISAILALIYVGSQIQGILSTVGSSI